MHLVPYLLVNVLLAFINVMTGGFPWMVIVLLGWGIGLGSHLLSVALPDQRNLRRRIERQRSRDARRQGHLRSRVGESVGDGTGGVRVAGQSEVAIEEEEAAIEEAAARDSQ